MLSWACVLAKRIDAGNKMGDWSKEAWGTDEAADWFGRYWNGGGIPLVLKTIHEFEPEAEQYEAVRAAYMVLGCFGSAYAWPSAHLEERLSALLQAIMLLTHMLNPPDDAWGFLDIWNHDEAVVKSVEQQIAVLNQHI